MFFSAVVLVKIIEGDETPYYKRNDGNVWIRTGNISNLIEIASPEHQELLFGKREKAYQWRSLLLKKARIVYDSALQSAERERKILVSRQNKDKEEGKLNIYSSELGIQHGDFEISIMPYYPKKSLMSPQQIKDFIYNNRTDQSPPNLLLSNFFSFDTRAIPDGVYRFDWDRYSGDIVNFQLYSQGLIYYRKDLVYVIENKSKLLEIQKLAYAIYMLLILSNKFYSKSGYSGSIGGIISLEKMNEDIYIRQIIPSRYSDYHDYTKSFLPNYKWEIEIDTIRLNNQAEFKKYFLDLLKNIYWDFGYTQTNDQLFEEHFIQKGMFLYI